LSAPAALASFDALRIAPGQRAAFVDRVIEEAPVALAYNGIAHAVMMATPADLEDFAFGFSLSEAIVDTPSQLRVVEIRKGDQGISIEIAVPQECHDRLAQRPRSLAAASGCGLCGLESLQAALRPPRTVDPGQAIGAEAIVHGMQALVREQELNRESGGVHAAGFVHAGGVLVREDVGRHNALDKLIGARARQALGDGFLVLSSRASYELVHKAATAGITLVATVSAPSSMAIRLADASGITLVCFARGEQMNVYTHPWRV